MRQLEDMLRLDSCTCRFRMRTHPREGDKQLIDPHSVIVIGSHLHEPARGGLDAAVGLLVQKYKH